jgi:hypothetical protein
MDPYNGPVEKVQRRPHGDQGLTHGQGRTTPLRLEPPRAPNVQA